MNAQLKILCVIVDRGLGKRIMNAIGKYVNFANVFYGRGTANSEAMAVFGFGEESRSIICGAITAENYKIVEQILLEKFRFNEAGKGIAFTVPVKSVGGMVALQTLYGKMLKKEVAENGTRKV